MSGGIWELRRDEITGWWSATVVDREFQPQRFHEARTSGAREEECANCAQGDSVTVTRRVLRQGAFHAVGTRMDAAAGESGFLTLSDVDRAGSWSTLIAPGREHGELDEVPVAVVSAFLMAIRDHLRSARDLGATAYIQYVRNAGGQAGAQTDQLARQPRRPVIQFGIGHHQVAIVDGHSTGLTSRDQIEQRLKASNPGERVR